VWKYCTVKKATFTRWMHLSVRKRMLLASVGSRVVFVIRRFVGKKVCHLADEKRNKRGSHLADNMRNNEEAA
jgi:hypothetical protein